MNRILLIAFGSELDKLLQIINQKYSFIKHIITVNTSDLIDVLEKNKVECQVSMYDRLPEIIQNEYFDYVVVSDIKKVSGDVRRIVVQLESYGVDKKKILDMSDFYTIESFPLYSLIKNYQCNENKYTFFITGVSHAFAGTDMSVFSSPGMNLALTSQDLFLDYEIAKLVIQYQKGDLKHAIIGVAPFSLHYDLSKSINDYRMFMYYPLLKKLHHYPIEEDKLKEIFNQVYFDSFNLFEEKLQFKQRLYCNSLDKVITIDDYVLIREKMQHWDDKYYDDTAMENKKILRDYVNLCQTNNIDPSLVIYPVSEWYNKYFSASKFDELRCFLQDLSSVAGIKFVDYSDDKRFAMNDFFDVEHLNVCGARKISGILNDEIVNG